MASKRQENCGNGRNVTGIREYVFEAFDVAAFHYLLKPIEEEKFAEVFDRAVEEAKKRKMQSREQLFISTRNRNITFDRKDILYVENRGRKVEIHTTKDTACNTFSGVFWRTDC